MFLAKCIDLIGTWGTLATLIAVAACFFIQADQAWAAGFKKITIRPPEYPPIEAGVWYPNKTAPCDIKNPFQDMLASNAPLEGSNLPLIIFSHGYTGWYGSHHDTALALADQGFVVVAPTHKSDVDLQGLETFVERPRQIRLVLDYMLKSWTEAPSLDPERVGIFGFSAGGFTALVAVGGTPDLQLGKKFCSAHPDEFICSVGFSKDTINMSKPLEWVHDQRIKAAVISSPALGFCFTPQGLESVRLPLQLWSAAADTHVPYKTNTSIIEQALPVTPQIYQVPDAEHFIFLPPCPKQMKKNQPDLWEKYCIDPPHIDRKAFHNDFNRKIVLFFNNHLPPGQRHR